MKSLVGFELGDIARGEGETEMGVGLVGLLGACAAHSNERRARNPLVLPFSRTRFQHVVIIVEQGCPTFKFVQYVSILYHILSCMVEA